MSAQPDGIMTPEEHLLTAQNARQIDHYQKQSDNLWLLTALNREHQTLRLSSIQCTLNIE